MLFLILFFSNLISFKKKKLILILFYIKLYGDVWWFNEFCLLANETGLKKQNYILFSFLLSSLLFKHLSIIIFFVLTFQLFLKTWARISSDSQKIYDHMAEILSHSASYAVYRNHLKVFYGNFFFLVFWI